MTSIFPLGFVSAILPDATLETVLRTATELGYDCVELMCWPPGDADRRYAGVTHVDVDAIDTPGDLQRRLSDSGVTVSGLGFYPNPLSPDPAAASVSVEHIRRVITGCASLGIGVMNSFIGRRPDPIDRRQLEPLPGHLGTIGRVGRIARGADWDRELSDAVHHRRMARGSQSGDQPCRLATTCSPTSPRRLSDSTTTPHTWSGNKWTR